MEYKWDITGKITGHAMVRMPEPEELLEIQKSVKYKTKIQDGVTKIDLSDSDSVADLTCKLQEIGVKHMTSVDLVHNKTGLPFKDAKSLAYYKPGRELLQKAGELVLNGIELGED